MMNLSYLKANVNSFRYERKFIISELNRHEVENIINCHPAMFMEIFQRRAVNNIYFDSLNMDSHYDSECGTSQRVKVRIRWYDRLFGIIEKPVLELKVKDNQLGSKISYPLIPFMLDSNVSINSFIDVFKHSNIPDVIREELASMHIVLLNHYSRKYFQSADRKYRLTVDWDMEYYVMDNVHNSFGNKKLDHFNTVLELKYSDDNDDGASDITNYFPFRLSKNSKYVVGIDSLFYLR